VNLRVSVHDPVTVAVDHGFLEAKSLDEEPD